MADSPVPSTQHSGAPRGQNRQPRRGRPSRNRGGRARGGSQTGGENLTRVASAAAAELATADVASSNPPINTSEGRGGRGSRGPRSRRGVRQPRGNRDHGNRTTFGTQRTFGGHLTTEQAEAEDDSGANAALNANAPAFVPGQPLASGSKAAQAEQAGKRNIVRRGTKSTALDLPTRIAEDISNGQYECVICTNEVLRNSKIWSCSICWTAAHLSCVKKWRLNQTKNQDQRQPEQQQTGWRCPGCNSTMTEEPTTYHCWCGKEINPKAIPGISPHGCGQTCSKPRGTCPHPCPLECHAGPCPPCLLMGPAQSCYCGKHTSVKRCGETDYNKGWGCHETCGDILPCGEHECQRECHSGLCGSCEIPIPSLCYCGRETKVIPCDRRGDKLESFDYSQSEAVSTIPTSQDLLESWFWGAFECGTVCGRPFDCGKHHCQKDCHPQDDQEAHCPFSPDLVTHCPCGKTPLPEILKESRVSCGDEIPNCGKICDKLLPCGRHTCIQTCHSGPCDPCTQSMDISCRCGRTESRTICHQGTVSAPECRRLCRAQLNCGRHEHGEHCCPAEKKAIERVAAKRKNKVTTVSNEEFEAEHICTRTCGRDLKCGRHKCQQLCHRGPCASCPEAIFDEISCNCGRTVLYPPQPCGTHPPECRFDCTRPRPCGHPQVSHNCHLDDQPCPKCPFLVEKRCVCGKQTLKNQPCWFQDGHCGLPCNKELKCGYHKCRMNCHRPGECEDADISGSHCKQPCMKSRQSCDHEDMEQCHAPYPCKEDKPCQARTFLTCECQHRKQEVKCMASKTNPWPQRVTLKCDDECLRLQRNARLANALNIDPQSHTDDHIPYSETTLKFYREKPKWAEIYEREYRVFASDLAEKRYRFKPMQSHQRAFLHSLAEDFGFDSESSDPEPQRHVCLFKTPRFVSAPMKTLAQCVRIRATQAQITATEASTSGVIAPKQPYNALLLSGPRFGLTVEEIDAAFKPDYAAHPTIKIQTSFLPSEEVVLKGSGSWTPQALETSLSSMKTAVAATTRRLDLAKGVSLCHVDDSLNVLRREENAQAKSDGWSAVIGRSAARPKPASTLGAASSASMPLRSRFIALRREPKKKVADAPVDEDWEAAAEKLDED